MNLSDPRWQVLIDVFAERETQDVHIGAFCKDLPDGTDTELFLPRLLEVNEQVHEAIEAGKVTWAMLVGESLCEVMAEEDEEILRWELVRLAAFTCAWAEALDRRKAER